MSRRDRLRARQLPRVTVALGGAGGEPELIELRALPADEFQVLMDEHPPTADQAAAGDTWDETSFRPALLAASEVPLDGEDPLTAEEWADLLTARMPLGERVHLWDTVLGLNDRTPAADLGKD